MKDSKYEGYQRVNGYTNMDMKSFHAKHGNMEGFAYGLIVAVAIFLIALSWVVVRDNHPFNDQVQVVKK